MYSQSASIHTPVLTEEKLRAHVPSIFTREASDRVSSKYTQINTIDVVRALMNHGFEPVKAMQCRTRKAGNQLYTKHMIRFRQAGIKPTVGSGLFPEVVLINSHDGLSSYQLIAGLYRLVCSNGMVAGKSYGEVRVRHQGDIVGKVIEGSYNVIKQSQQLLEASNEMSAIQLSNDERKIFAESVHALKFDGDEGLTPKAIAPERFLKARRYQELEKNDLFTVFNVAQENVIKGGLRGWARDERGIAHTKTTREVKSIDQSTALNRALWTLAQKMAELKA